MWGQLGDPPCSRHLPHQSTAVWLSSSSGETLFPQTYFFDLEDMSWRTLPLLHLERKLFQMLFVSSWHLQTEGKAKELGCWQSVLWSFTKSLLASLLFPHNNSSSNHYCPMPLCCRAVLPQGSLTSIFWYLWKVLRKKDDIWGTSMPACP